jgi:hypothetical protein
MLFERQTTLQVSMMMSVTYLAYVCAPVAPGPMPVPMPVPAPAQTPTPTQPATGPETKTPLTVAAAPETPSPSVTLKPVEPPATQEPSDWQELQGVKAKAARFDVWRTLGQLKPCPVEVSLTDSPGVSKTVTPRSVAADGLTFTAANPDASEEVIPFAKLNRLRVL